MQLFARHYPSAQFQVFTTGRDALAWVLWADAATLATTNTQKQGQHASIWFHGVNGKVTMSEIAFQQKAWFDNENFSANAPIIWDLRDAQLQASMPEPGPVAQELQDNATLRRPDGRPAILVNSKFQEVMLLDSFSDVITAGRLAIFRKRRRPESFCSLSYNSPAKYLSNVSWKARIRFS